MQDEAFPDQHCSGNPRSHLSLAGRTAWAMTAGTLYKAAGALRQQDRRAEGQRACRAGGLQLHAGACKPGCI